MRPQILITVRISIIDYQCGNLGSIQNMIRKIGEKAIITSDPEIIEKSSHIILPGVGSFDFGMNQLNKLNLTSVLNKKKGEGVSIMGVCLGAQLMCKSSEEGKLPGLGFVDAYVKKFPVEINGIRKKVPHMGWDHVSPAKDSAIFSELQDARFYFVHSYYIHCENQRDILSVNSYGVDFHSAYERNNVLGLQFHPEKSHKFGKQIYKNFIDLY